MTNVLAQSASAWRRRAAWRFDVVRDFMRIPGNDEATLSGRAVTTGRRATQRQKTALEKKKAVAQKRNGFIFWLPDLGSNQGPTD
jgi:hypothetical protein